MATWASSSLAPALLLWALSFIAVHRALIASAQSLPPSKYDGFVYAEHRVDSGTIVIEAFLDPVCPDSRDSWPPLKEAVDYYGPRVWLVVHLLPLPYHDNAYVASRALNIVNMLNTSATFPLLELFFKEQSKIIHEVSLTLMSLRDIQSLMNFLKNRINSTLPFVSQRMKGGFLALLKESMVKFYNAQTLNMSKASVVSYIANFATQVVADSLKSAVVSGFENTRTDLKTRVSFKYSASRGVFGTPTFFVNGFSLPDSDSTTSYGGWRSIIDPLITAQGDPREENVYFF